MGFVGVQEGRRRVVAARADEPLVDTHVHFWDHSVDGLRWEWLEPGFKFRLWESDGSLDAPRYTPPEFLAEAAGSGVAAVVHGHSANPIDDPVVETEWLESVAAEYGIPQALIGACRLSAPDAADVLERHARHPHVRGVRDVYAAEYRTVDEIAAAMDAAASLGLSIEVRRSHDAFQVLADLATRWPTVTITLSHGCLPLRRTPSDLASWGAAMRSLAPDPTHVCKISAVAGATDPDWTPTSIRPWIVGCIDALGADRCMLGSNWPVDRMFATYVRLIGAYREATAELTSAERAAVFHRTAERVYSIDPVR